MQDRLRLETQLSFEEHLVKCIWRFVKKKKLIAFLFCTVVRIKGFYTMTGEWTTTAALVPRPKIS